MESVGNDELRWRIGPDRHRMRNERKTTLIG